MMNNFVRMLNEDFISYNECLELLPPVREQLKNEIFEVLEEYDWEPADEGIDALLDEWWEKKGQPMTELFGHHPNYINGKFMIVLDDTVYVRGIDTGKLIELKDYVHEWLCNKYAYVDVCEDNNVEGNWYCTVTSHGYNLHRYTRENLAYIDNVVNAFDIVIENLYSKLVTDEMEAKIKALDNDFHVHSGQKITKFIGKICREIGVDQSLYYNRRYAIFCDNFSPKEFKRKTVISWNPIDYFLMSNGNSWSSCHTTNKSNHSSGYGGMYCGGTESYMLDGVSIVFYSIREDYFGEEYEREPKIERCMFHIDPERNFFIQGRVYPQSSDGAGGTYKSVREIMQKLMSEVWNIDNKWILKRGTSICSNLSESIGLHYKDYQCFPGCNVSFNKSVDDVKQKAKPITIGHNGICITCGSTHRNNDYITCGCCTPDFKEYTCANCGEPLDEDEAYWVESEDEYYCGDCCTYCEICEQYEPNHRIHEINRSYVCDYCLENNSRFVQCEYCEEWIDTEWNDAVFTEDGRVFCDEDCAEREDYVYIEDGGWYQRTEAYYCEECDTYHFEDDFDIEHNMCLSCAEDLLEEEDDEELDEAV